MIFVTLGSQKFQFDRLLRKMDELVEQGVIQEEVFAQTGYSTYVPRHFPSQQFLNREEFVAMEAKADIVITHGGTGAILGAVKKGKKVIAVPRSAKFGEHVDNHQTQLVRQFGGMGIIEACYNMDELGQVCQKCRQTQYTEYVSSTHRIIDSIEEYLTNEVSR